MDNIINGIITFLINRTLTVSILIIIILFVKKLLYNKLNARINFLIWYIVIFYAISVCIPSFSIELNLNRITEYFKENFTKEQTIYKTNYFEENNNNTNSNEEKQIDFINNEIQQNKNKFHQFTISKKVMMYLFALWLFGIIILACIISYKNYSNYKKVVNSLYSEKNANLIQDIKYWKQIMKINKHIILKNTDIYMSPCLLGVLKPKILLPSWIIKAFSEEQIRYILVHELAHIKRKDVLTNWLITITQLIYWFNPFVWIAFYNMRKDMELACDSLALSYIDEKELKNYGNIIIQMAEYYSTYYLNFGFTTFINKKSQIYRRINMIKKYNKRSYKITLLSSFIIVAIICIASYISPKVTTNLKAMEQQKNDINASVTKDNISDEIFYGTWVIEEVLDSSNPSIYEQSELDNFIQKEVTYSKNNISYENNKCSNPYYFKEIIDKENFITDYIMDPSKLGLDNQDITRISVYTDAQKSNYWNEMGDSFIIKNENELIAINGGVFFKMVRKK